MRRPGCPFAFQLFRIIRAPVRAWCRLPTRVLPHRDPVRWPVFRDGKTKKLHPTDANQPPDPSARAILLRRPEGQRSLDISEPRQTRQVAGWRKDLCDADGPEAPDHTAFRLRLTGPFRSDCPVSLTQHGSAVVDPVNSVMTQLNVPPDNVNH